MASVLRKYEMTGFECDTFSSTFWFTAWHVWPEAKQPLLVASGYINRQGPRTAAGGGEPESTAEASDFFSSFFHKKRFSLGQRRRRSSGKTDNNNKQQCQSETIQPLPLLPSSSFPAGFLTGVWLCQFGNCRKAPREHAQCVALRLSKDATILSGRPINPHQRVCQNKAFPPWRFSNHGRDPSSLHHKRRKSQNVSPFIFRCVCDDFAPAAV